MMFSPKNLLYNGLYSTITFKKVMVVVCSVLLLIDSFGTAVADNPFFNQTIRATTTPSGANQPLINQQLYGFDGQLTDPESGYQFLGRGYHRAYNPVTRRFMSQDSMSPFSKGGFNGYIFASNNPIMHQDPSGHMSSNFWLNIVGILGAIAGAILAPLTGGSTAVIAAGEMAAVTGATAGSLGAAGAATHNKALQKASLGLGIASAAIDAVNIIGSGANLAAVSVDTGAEATSESSDISTTVGGAIERIDNATTTDTDTISTASDEYSDSLSIYEDARSHLSDDEYFSQDETHENLLSNGSLEENIPDEVSSEQVLKIKYMNGNNYSDAMKNILRTRDGIEEHGNYFIIKPTSRTAISLMNSTIAKRMNIPNSIVVSVDDDGLSVYSTLAHGKFTSMNWLEKTAYNAAKRNVDFLREISRYMDM